MWNVQKKKKKIKNIHQTFLVKPHNFCLDKLASEAKWVEISTLFPTDGFVPQNRLLLYKMQLKQLCPQSGLDPCEVYADFAYSD